MKRIVYSFLQKQNIKQAVVLKKWMVYQSNSQNISMSHIHYPSVRQLDQYDVKGVTC